MAKHIVKLHAKDDTPLAKQYREARSNYRSAGQQLRRSCESPARECGYPKPFKVPGRKRFRLVAGSAKHMRQQFLAAGDNDNVLREQLGHLNVKDPVQWEAIYEKYGTKRDRKPETFDEAFKILARVAKRNWADFDIEILRELPGLDRLELPEAATEARNQEETEAHYNEVPF